jgi:hypothetical protein
LGLVDNGGSERSKGAPVGTLCYTVPAGRSCDAQTMIEE